MSKGGVPIHEMIKPLSWLLGRWRGEGMGKYPTISDFNYKEEIEFSHVGQPMLQYSAYSYKTDNGAPLHREIGFVRIQPGTKHIAMVLAHNNGVSDLEEGECSGMELTCETVTMSNMTFGEDPFTKKLKRTFRLDGEKLSQVLWMETDKTEMTEHLRAEYSKVN